MKGQHLFVRPIEPADRDAIQAFLDRHSEVVPSQPTPATTVETGTSPPPPAGLLGKLVGDLVAVLVMDITSSCVRVEQLVVAPELRRKRIGRTMIDELASLATKIDQPLLVVEHPGNAGGFFERVGFETEGGRYVRRVGHGR